MLSFWLNLVWERDPSTLMVLKTNECPFDPLDVCHGEEDARFIVMRSTCLTAQQMIKNRNDKLWLSQNGILPHSLISLQEMAHHIYRFLYREVMVPRDWVQNQIDQFKQSVDWEHKYVIGIHIRTGGVQSEVIRWGRFLNEKDVRLFKRYASTISISYEKGTPLGGRTNYYMKSNEMEKFNNRYPVLWYVVSDQKSIKDTFLRSDRVVSTNCALVHTNRARENKEDPGFTCALIENYLLSSSDILVLTKRSTYGYLARHRTNAPFVTIDVGDFKKKQNIPVEVWDAFDMCHCLLNKLSS